MTRQTAKKILGFYSRVFSYPATATILLFFAIATAVHNTISIETTQALLGGIVLFFSYAVAISINDLADENVDIVNERTEKPLVSGLLNRRDLYILNATSTILCLFFAFAINIYTFFIALASIFLSYAYSLPPLKLAYRTHLPLVVLGISYVGIPYAMALSIGKINPSKIDWLLFASLLLFFTGRILLKDFPDQKGDSQYGKKTFLLKYGDGITHLVALGLFIVGTIVFIASFATNLLLTSFTIIFSCVLIFLTHTMLRPKRRYMAKYLSTVFNALLVVIFSVFYAEQEKFSPLISSFILGMFAVVIITNLANKLFFSEIG